MKYRLTLFAVAASFAIALPAYSGGAKNITVSEALNGRVPIVVAAEGGGVIVDLGQTDEVIKKATIDDPSRITVDVTEGIPVLRLFVANIPVKDIPRAKTTQLTVMTQTKEGEWKTYIFPVTVSTKSAAYTKFVVGGQSEQDTKTTFVTAAAGFQQAQRQKTLVDPRLKGRARMYLSYLKAGHSPNQARRKAKISKAMAQKLDELGQEAPKRGAAPTAVLPVPSAPTKPIEKSLPPPPSVEPKPKQQAKVDSAPQDKKIEKAVPRDLPRAIPQARNYTKHDYANAIVRGLVVARNSKNWEIYDRRWKYNDAVYFLRKGATLEKAAKRAGVTESQLLKVIEMGGITLAEKS
jgi:hypothetical protein